jgi:UDP-N-acetylglucosamine 2-epimerase (non-hydrolysing)
MPEEHNRVLIDHLADLCFAPTPGARDNLLAERVRPEHVEVTGNTIVEAVARGMPAEHEQQRILSLLGLPSRSYVLATFHRPENADDPAALAAILRELAACPVPAILSMHPRTQRRITAFALDHAASRLRLTGPLSYPALLSLIRHSAAVVSDSGGIQEEVTVLKRPIVVVRRSNERPEVEGTFGVRVLPGPDISGLVATWLATGSALDTLLASRPSPYGDGSASARIVSTIRQRFHMPP